MSSGSRLIVDDQFENLSAVTRVELSAPKDAQNVDRFVMLGDEGMASGIDDTFDIDELIEDTWSGR